MPLIYREWCIEQEAEKAKAKTPKKKAVATTEPTSEKKAKVDPKISKKVAPKKKGE